MVDSIADTLAAGLASASVPSSSASSGGQTDSRFDAALAAAQRAAAEQSTEDEQMSEIRSKGFVAYARDTLAASFREKLREQMLKSMGLTDSSLAQMPQAVQNAVEKVIEAAIQQQLDQVGNTTKSKAATGSGGQSAGSQTAQGQSATQVAGQDSTGQKKPTGMTCPLIPILAWPGGPSLLG